MTTEQDALASLLRKVQEKRRRIGAFVNKLEPRGALLVNLSIVCGALATMLTTGPAMSGRQFMTALGAAEPGSATWRIMCTAAVFCSLIATIATNLYKTRDMASRLAKAQACDAKLEELEVLVQREGRNKRTARRPTRWRHVHMLRIGDWPTIRTARLADGRD
jgi:hypothetical protein